MLAVIKVISCCRTAVVVTPRAASISLILSGPCCCRSLRICPAGDPSIRMSDSITVLPNPDSIAREYNDMANFCQFCLSKMLILGGYEMRAWGRPSSIGQRAAPGRYGGERPQLCAVHKL